MDDFLLILRDHPERWTRFSPDEQQAVIARFNAWNQALRAEERLVSAGKLSREPGPVLRRRDDQIAVDGPFPEAKEALSGFYVVRAESLEAARALAEGCPILDLGGSVEVRALVVLIGAAETPPR